MVMIHLFQVLSLLAVAQAGVVGRNNSSTPGKSESPSGQSTANQAEVIIIGGGIAGISVARQLIQEHNITNILLIEARDELGGRAHTETLTGNDGKSWTVEKGCNWIQGPGKEPIEALAAKWNLSSTPTDYGDVIFFEGKAGVEGVQESGMRGSFLTDDEALVFTEGYDNFLENAAGYSGE
jgi:polyamine oxidase